MKATAIEPICELWKRVLFKVLEIISALAVFMTLDKVIIAGEALLQGFSLSQQLPDRKLKSTWLAV